MEGIKGMATGLEKGDLRSPVDSLGLPLRPRYSRLFRPSSLLSAVLRATMRPLVGTNGMGYWPVGYFVEAKRDSSEGQRSISRTERMLGGLSFAANEVVWHMNAMRQVWQLHRNSPRTEGCLVIHQAGRNRSGNMGCNSHGWEQNCGDVGSDSPGMSLPPRLDRKDSRLFRSRAGTSVDSFRVSSDKVFIGIDGQIQGERGAVMKRNWMEIIGHWFMYRAFVFWANRARRAQGEFHQALERRDDLMRRLTGGVR